LQYHLNFDTGTLSSSDGYTASMRPGNRRTCVEILEPVPDARYFVTLGGTTEELSDWREAYQWLNLGI